MATQLPLFAHFSEPNVCDPDEAPDGYYAIPKTSVPQDQGNICQFCDWRPTCQRDDTDFYAPGHRCMGYAIIARGGRTIERRDQCSVIFKRR